MAQHKMISTGPKLKCPACGAGDRCSVRDDGRVVYCRKGDGRPATGYGPAKPAADGDGWVYWLQDREPPRPVERSQAPARDWTAEAEDYAARLRDSHRHELAAALKLPVAALASLPLIGVSRTTAAGSVFTFPETDHTGRVLGISERYPDTSKRMIRGGHRGLTIPAGWREKAGPVFVVEGPSDVLAMTHAGLSCVGRPSNTGGVELLAELLRDLPADRPIVVLGENDKREVGR